MERVDEGILYHDGLGRTHRFTRMPGRNDLVSPDGFYAVLTAEDERVLLKQRFGTVFVFGAPEAGGYLLAIEDRNGNALTFEHTKEAIRVADSLDRRMTIAFDRGRIVEVRDHAGRAWRYDYDQNGCLIEVMQPSTDEFPGGSRIRYRYDERFRLTSITDPNGQTFLRNVYDDQGRVVFQEHGNGSFEFGYETVGRANCSGWFGGRPRAWRAIRSRQPPGIPTNPSSSGAGPSPIPAGTRWNSNTMSGAT
jgi:YD repeat-containing protein